MDIVMNADAHHDSPGVGVRGSSEYSEEARAAHNTQKHNARLLYTIDLASCRAHYIKKERGTA
jgi:hypothetical protein